jgi:hypothetical protein
MNAWQQLTSTSVRLLLVLAFSTAAYAADQTDPMSGGSSTVIGANAQLSQGAVALMNNDLKRGIELTEAGLSAPLPPKDRAVGLSNLCAGYAAIKQWRKGFKSCEESLDIDVANWRAWQNRAACNLGLGRLRESRDDIEHGLRLNPSGPSLRKSLDVIDQHERNKLELERLRALDARDLDTDVEALLAQPLPD